MPSLLYGILSWAMSGLVANLIVGAGLTLVVLAGVLPAVQALLENGSNSLSGMPADVVSLALLSGVGEAMSILGSALLTRVGLVMASNVVGLRRAST